ncbi:MAG: DUF2953 domain-containing protein [Oscillospiraceae bacterium]|nr:DUF2953 domain-containing protein [Oscillospiraceae bacterium]
MGWLIALGILILLAILPLGVTVRYNCDGLALKLIAGPLRIGILPQKDKPKKAKEKKPKQQKTKTQKPAQKTAQKPKEKGGPIADFLPLVQTALQLLNSFRKKLRIKRLEMKLIMAGDDPCDLAINYGKAWAALGNLMPQLERCFVIKKRDLEVECDFESSETRIIARADVTITLGWLLGILIWYGVRAVKQFFEIKNKRKGGATK